MGLNRRNFLQQAGLTLFTLGATEAGINILGKQDKLPSLIQPYLQALAQTSKRKLALLVGINQYSANSLDGCITDVELQRELLIHRFGFQPEDILTLSDKLATRKAIETAFVEHLGKQAKAGDVVVFHFSGYGSQVKLSPDRAEISETKLINGLVPVDGIVSTKNTTVGNYLSQETLNYLGRSLDTDKLTMILDTSFVPNPESYQGNFKIRSWKQIAENFSSEELAFREQIQAELNNGILNFGNNNSALPGILLSAAGKNQVAVEYKGDSFSAGLFTYALTQYLWQITPASKIQITLQKIGEEVEELLGTKQKPTLVGKSKPLFTYYLQPNQTDSAEGIVIDKEDKNSIELMLTGLPIKVLDNYGVNSCFSLVPTDESAEDKSVEELIWLQIRGREGLTAKTQLLNKENSPQDVAIGQLAQEVMRVLPQDLGLIMALDTSLPRIERVDATSAFANVATVANVAAKGEQNADYLLGKITRNVTNVKTKDSTEETETSSKEPLQEKVYGLFSFGGDVINKTVGSTNEAAKLAVKRLTPQLDTLLAYKWLDLIVNQGSSLLGVKVTLESSEPNTSLVAEKTTFRAKTTRTKLPKLAYRDDLDSGKNLDFTLPSVSNESQLLLRINNYEDYPLYLMLLGVDADGDAIALLNAQAVENAENTNQIQDIAIAPKQELIIPTPNDSLDWKISSSEGMAKVFLIFATAPFTNTNSTLSTKPNVKLNKEQIMNIPNPLDVTKALLTDLHQASAVKPEILGSNTNVYALDVRHWATISFAYKVV